MCTNLMLSVPTTVGQSDRRPTSAPAAWRCPGSSNRPSTSCPAGRAGRCGFAATVPVAQPEARGTSTYTFVGIASSDTWQQLPNFNDGLNDQGLSVGALWLQPGTQYPEGASSVSSFDLPAWILGQCATVARSTALLGPDATARTRCFTVAHRSRPMRAPRTRTSSHCTTSSPTTRGEHHHRVRRRRTNVYDSTDGVIQRADVHCRARTSTTTTTSRLVFRHVVVAHGGGPTPAAGLPGELACRPRASSARGACRRGSTPSCRPTASTAAGAGAAAGHEPGPARGVLRPEHTAVVVAMQLVQICMARRTVLLEQQPMSPKTYGDSHDVTSVRDHTNLNYYFVGAFSASSCVDLTEIDFATMPPTQPQGSTSSSISILPPNSIAQWSHVRASSRPFPSTSSAIRPA